MCLSVHELCRVLIIPTPNSGHRALGLGRQELIRKSMGEGERHLHRQIIQFLDSFTSSSHLLSSHLQRVYMVSLHALICFRTFSRCLFADLNSSNIEACVHPYISPKFAGCLAHSKYSINVCSMNCNICKKIQIIQMQKTSRLNALSDHGVQLHFIRERL